jgi:hypothetical protein
MKKKNNDYEEYPFEPEEHAYMIRPQVFGSQNKFGQISDNGRVMKVEGKYQHQGGKAATLKATGYWYLIHAILRELKMTSRDRFILEEHADGRTAKQINRALKEHDYFKPYQKSEYVNGRIQSLIRNYFIAPKSELNRVF